MLRRKLAHDHLCRSGGCAARVNFLPMTATPTPVLPDRIAGRQIILWSVFTALLVIGLVLYFRFANSFAPLLDVLTER